MKKLLIGATKHFSQCCADPEQVQRRVLKEILRLSSASEYGKEHQISDQWSVEEYSGKIHLSDYSSWEPYILRISTGEQNILTPETVHYFLMSTGTTTGISKYIPCTPSSSAAMGRLNLATFGRILQNTGDALPERLKGLAFVSSGIHAKKYGNIHCGHGSGHVNRISQGAGASLSMDSVYVQPAFLNLDYSPAYIHACWLKALQEKELAFITSAYPLALLDAFLYLENHLEQLTGELESGDYFSQYEDIEKDVKDKLSSVLKVEPCSEFRSVRNYWRNLAFLVTIRGGTYHWFEERIEKICPDISIYHAGYKMAEGGVGVGGEHSDLTTLALESAFYEIIPADDSSIALPCWQWEEGLEGELVISTYNGILRYKTGDLVRVQGFEKKAPKLLYLRRKGGFVTLYGEKITEQQIVSVVRDVRSQMNLKELPFSMGIDADSFPPGYIFFVEGLRHENEPQFCSCFDSLMRERYGSYNRCRKSGTVGEPLALSLPPGKIASLWKNYKKMSESEQIKTPILCEDRNFVRYCRGVIV